MNTKARAKILLEMSENSSGALDLERVKAVCDYIESNIPQNLRRELLKEFLSLAKVRLEKSRSKVLHAGNISSEKKSEIENFIKKINSQSEPEFVRDDSLIGGVRVEVGDFVWENSIKMKLDELAKSFK